MTSSRLAQQKCSFLLFDRVAFLAGETIRELDEYVRAEIAEHGAEIYLGQDSHGIQVIDQWNNRDSRGRITSQQGPHQRTIRFGNVGGSVVNQGER